MGKFEINFWSGRIIFKNKFLFIFYIFILSLISINIVTQIYNINLLNQSDMAKGVNKNIQNILKNLNNSLYFNYINSCKKLQIFKNRVKIKNKYPFLSICISVYNSEKYIKKAVLSIINQSFQNFEIIIINDCSNDNTYNIIMKLKSEDKRIIIINHKKNYGTYHSRVEGVLNSRGKYILFVDPDDLILNPYLFEILYYYYKNFNLDIIEFTVYHQIEEKNKILYPKNHKLNHNHNYSNKIIYQPQLSNIIFYKPQTNNYSNVICRTIWNKLYKREIILKSIKLIILNFGRKEEIYLMSPQVTTFLILNI